MWDNHVVNEITGCPVRPFFGRDFRFECSSHPRTSRAGPRGGGHLQVVASTWDNASDSTPWVVHIVEVSRDHVNVSVRHCLAGCRSVVHSNGEAIRRRPLERLQSDHDRLYQLQ